MDSYLQHLIFKDIASIFKYLLNVYRVVTHGQNGCLADQSTVCITYSERAHIGIVNSERSGASCQSKAFLPQSDIRDFQKHDLSIKIDLWDMKQKVHIFLPYNSCP